MYKYKKVGNTSDRIVKQMEKLGRETVEIGHFVSQGKHPTAVGEGQSPLTFVELMQIHDAGDSGRITSRPVLEILKKEFKVSSISNIGVRKFSEHILSPLAIKEIVEALGRDVAKFEKNMFGNTAYLPTVEGNSNPLVDTGELRDHVAWKVSGEGLNVAD